MAIINSVLGPLDTKDLGFTLGHEHIINAACGISQNYPELLGAGFMEEVTRGLVEAKAAGVSTIVDASTMDIGRDVSLMAEFSRRSGVNIIACAGMRMDVLPHFTDFPPDRLAEVFVREIKRGIAGTEIKAGILKGASDKQGVTHGETVILRAIARAHHQTGVPIMLHSYCAINQVARKQLAIIKEEGVDLRHVRIDHSSETTDVEFLIWLLDQGCYLDFDRGVNVSPTGRAKTLKALLDAGYADRICISHDWSNAFMWAEAVPAMKKWAQ